jgi:hypothetical protein
MRKPQATEAITHSITVIISRKRRKKQSHVPRILHTDVVCNRIETPMKRLYAQSGYIKKHLILLSSHTARNREYISGASTQHIQ